MKIKTPKSKKKALVVVGTIIATLTAGLLIYLYPMKGTLFGWSPTKSYIPGVNLDAPTDEQKQAGENTKNASLNPPEEQKPNNTNETPSPPSPSPGKKDSVSLTITAANQNSPSFQIRSEIGTVTSEGTCTLTLTKGSKTVTRTADVQALPRISTCKGFDIPLSELSSGQWNVALHFENSTVIADATKQITVQ